jgi:nitrogen fixation-related uncharacterized protein
MAIFYGLLLASMILLGGSAVYALYWAAEDGQFSKMEDGSKIIFDAEEPEGNITDAFPGVDVKRALAAKALRRQQHSPLKSS